MTQELKPIGIVINPERYSGTRLAELRTQGAWELDLRNTGGSVRRRLISIGSNTGIDGTYLSVFQSDDGDNL